MAKVGRILRSADFQRALGTPPRVRSAHFAAHHVAVCPSQPAKARPKALAENLSTGDALTCPPIVDDPSAERPEAVPQGCWLGMVVPKKHARRALTRNLIKRQMRALMDGACASLPAGLWVLRLKAPFDRGAFTSPASELLRQAARDELQLLLQRAAASRR
jgi:ribonuclease P protein component